MKKFGWLKTAVVGILGGAATGVVSGMQTGQVSSEQVALNAAVGAGSVVIAYLLKSPVKTK